MNFLGKKTRVQSGKIKKRKPRKGRGEKHVFLGEKKRAPPREGVHHFGWGKGWI